uniref:Protein kinase domain-containing protein n=1 Tax=Corethron hystrix TaxID=216773 RepID=A0A7S1B466_9STRA|mmetsp:Transcript_1229/g.2491  ORF Transcript_1229/g.2491 Transcript_1229/m.2491 type:complete len:121 (+) Transcript_1229:587-949(+)
MMIDDVYNLTGNTGSRRYMAPEVAQFKFYNEKCDVYSFGILFWQICALKTPFQEYDYSRHEREVIYGCARPAVKSTWPKSCGKTMESCWDASIQKRPDFCIILKILQEECKVLENMNTDI